MVHKSRKNSDSKSDLFYLLTVGVEI